MKRVQNKSLADDCFLDYIPDSELSSEYLQKYSEDLKESLSQSLISYHLLRVGRLSVCRQDDLRELRVRCHSISAENILRYIDEIQSYFESRRFKTGLMVFGYVVYASGKSQLKQSVLNAINQHRLKYPISNYVDWLSCSYKQRLDRVITEMREMDEKYKIQVTKLIQENAIYKSSACAETIRDLKFQLDEKNRIIMLSSMKISEMINVINDGLIINKHIRLDVETCLFIVKNFMVDPRRYFKIQHLKILNYILSDTYVEKLRPYCKRYPEESANFFEHLYAVLKYHSDDQNLVLGVYLLFKLLLEVYLFSDHPELVESSIALLKHALCFLPVKVIELNLKNLQAYFDIYRMLISSTILKGKNEFGEQSELFLKVLQHTVKIRQYRSTCVEVNKYVHHIFFLTHIVTLADQHEGELFYGEHKKLTCNNLIFLVSCNLNKLTQLSSIPTQEIKMAIGQVDKLLQIKCYAVSQYRELLTYKYRLLPNDVLVLSPMLCQFISFFKRHHIEFVDTFIYQDFIILYDRVVKLLIESVSIFLSKDIPRQFLTIINFTAEHPCLFNRLLKSIGSSDSGQFIKSIFYFVKHISEVESAKLDLDLLDLFNKLNIRKVCPDALLEFGIQYYDLLSNNTVIGVSRTIYRISYHLLSCVPRTNTWAPFSLFLSSTTSYCQAQYYIAKLNLLRLQNCSWKDQGHCIKLAKLSLESAASVDPDFLMPSSKISLISLVNKLLMKLEDLPSADASQELMGIAQIS